MEFLYKLYSNEYFGIGLFIVITILAFSFLVILFFGKKDQKASLESANQSQLNSDNPEIENNKEQALKTDSLESMTLSNNNINENISVEAVSNASNQEDIPSVVATNPSEGNIMVEQANSFENKQPEENSMDIFNSFPIEEEPMPKNESVAPIESPQDIFSQDSSNEANQEALNMNLFADDFSKDTKIEDNEKKNNVFDDTLVMNSPILEDVNPDMFKVDLPVIEKPEPESNDVFAEENANETPDGSLFSPTISQDFVPPKEEIKEEEIAPIPIKPSFDLPKMADMPKLNKVGQNNEQENKDNQLNNIFEKMEEESYKIHE